MGRGFPSWPTERQVEWADRLGVEEENLRVAIRWFFTHDITPLPHASRPLAVLADARPDD
jgi:hypothetical protein